MLTYSREMVALAKEGNMEKLAMEIMRTNSVIDIAQALAERIIQEKETPKSKRIVVTREEMDLIESLFRVRGLAADGQEIKRGRPSKKGN